MIFLCGRYESLCVEFVRTICKFSIKVDQTKLFTVVIYASNSHMVQRQLWKELTNFQEANINTCCLIGDLNAVIGSHENFGIFPPNKTSTNEFLSWTNQNEFFILRIMIDITLGQMGGKSGAYSSDKLDKAICN